MRALAMDFRSDPRALNIGDQFMFGPAMLVSPVTEPGADTRRMYLPKATWYDFWTGTQGRRRNDHHNRCSAGSHAAVCARRIHHPDGP